MMAEQCSPVVHVNMKTLNLHFPYNYTTNSMIGLVNQVCEEFISNGLSKHGIHFMTQSCIIEHWSFRKGVCGQIM
jgi:hypothetical protein